MYKVEGEKMWRGKCEEMKRVSTALSSWSSECKVGLTAEEERRERNRGGGGGKKKAGKGNVQTEEEEEGREAMQGDEC